jgi:hypothetical protein
VSESTPSSPASASRFVAPDSYQLDDALRRRLDQVQAAAFQRVSERQQAQEHFAAATTMYRETGMTYWAEKMEREMAGLT